MQSICLDANGDIIDEENETPCKMEKSKMKIDVATIEHCALEAIAEQIGNPWEYCTTGEHEADGMRLVALGAVAGILNFVDELKETLAYSPRAPMPEEEDY